jgi:hypothetical protein
VSRDYKFVRQDKPRHQIWVTPENQDQARANRPKVHTKHPCPNCGRLFASRKLAAHKENCK